MESYLPYTSPRSPLYPSPKQATTSWYQAYLDSQKGKINWWKIIIYIYVSLFLAIFPLCMLAWIVGFKTDFGMLLFGIAIICGIIVEGSAAIIGWGCLLCGILSKE